MDGTPPQVRRPWVRWALVAAALLAALTVVVALAAGTDEDGADRATASSAGGSPSIAPTPSGGEAPPGAQVGDVTEELRTAAGGAVWGAAVVSAERTEPDRVEIRTAITDPGSPEAQQAIAVCEGAVGWLEGQGVTDPYVDVQGADGTGLVRHGDPAGADGECTAY
ncbi:hypothetical protein ACI780_09070 [Geodermatophilus sp. SYSU D00814]